VLESNGILKKITIYFIIIALNKLLKYHIKLIKKINLMCNLPIKRYFLPLIGIIGIIAVEGVISYSYLPFIVGFSSFILFWNFPKLAIMFNSRPTYYEDLFVSSHNKVEVNLNGEERKRFENIFEWALIISSSILCGGLSCYWLFNSQTRNVITFFEIMGITGGILKIYYIVNYTIGSVIIYFLKKKIKNNENKELSEVVINYNEIYDVNTKSTLIDNSACICYNTDGFNVES
tara:strand:- start:133 stop:831 length:699 start_codon:yes stop_codon:yes gene_type:complete